MTLAPAHKGTPTAPAKSAGFHPFFRVFLNPPRRAFRIPPVIAPPTPAAVFSNSRHRNSYKYKRKLGSITLMDPI